MAFADSLASKLKMPMAAGGAQGAKKTVDEELDDQFGSKDDEGTGSGKKGKFDPKTPLGEATASELQAALDAKQNAKPGEKDESDDDEASDDNDDGEGGEPDDGSRPTY